MTHQETLILTAFGILFWLCFFVKWLLKEDEEKFGNLD